MSYCNAGFCRIIQCDLRTLSLPSDSLRDNLYMCAYILSVLFAVYLHLANPFQNLDPSARTRRLISLLRREGEFQIYRNFYLKSMYTLGVHWSVYRWLIHLQCRLPMWKIYEKFGVRILNKSTLLSNSYLKSVVFLGLCIKWLQILFFFQRGNA